MRVTGKNQTHIGIRGQRRRLVGVSLTSELHAALTTQASKLAISRSRLVALLIQGYLEGLKK